MFFFSTLTPLSSEAWGGRGHHVICSAAVHLVQEANLKDFLVRRGHTMGHLCNVPDIYWKSLPGKAAKSGDPTHYFNPEVIGRKVAEVPLDFQKIQKEFTGKDNLARPGRKIFSVPEDVGSLWWRVDQFSRRAAGLKSAFQKAKKPKDRQQEQLSTLPYNKAVYEFMITLGLMGHFVGDAAQPLHNTADFDGYGSGHGGLHSYYEEAVVSAAPADLEARVFAEAKALNGLPWLKELPTIERMRAFSDVILKDLPRVLEKDPVKKASQVKKEKGMELRTPAIRPSSKEGWKAFEPLVVNHMASSARLLAILWDEAYRKAGKPDLGAYRSYKYPFTPEFVSPDYVGSAP